MKRLKFLLLTVVCVAVLFCVATVTVSADVVASGSCGVNVTYTFDSEGILTISGTGEMGYYYPPSSVPWYSIRAEIKKVIIEDGVTSIGYYAFRDCFALESVTIPESVTSIGYSALFDCSALTSIAIPESVTSIGNSVFWGCSALESVTIPESVTSIGDYAFCDCSALTSITIPDSVTSIGDYAFYDCSALTSITIPDSVMSIGDYAFMGCSSLENVTIPDSVTSIGDYTFYGCDTFTIMYIPNNVTKIGESAFAYCDNLSTVILGESVKSIDKGAFAYCYNLNTVGYTKDQVNKETISIATNNEKLLNAKWYYNFCKTEHSYSGDCDANCNICEFPRTVNASHTYTNTCDDTCNICGYVTAITHTFTDDCDSVCNICSFEREIIYDYTITTDEDITLSYSTTANVRFVVSDESIAHITGTGMSSVVVGSYVSKKASATITPKKPGGVIVSVVDSYNNVLAKSLLLVVEGEHQFEHSKTISVRDCVTPGKAVYVCKFCAFEKEEYEEAYGHSYSYGCDSICNRCDFVRTDISHDNTKSVAEVKATCTTKGSTAGVYCNDCAKYISGHVEIPVDADAHKWDSGTVTTTATCKVSGVKTYTCQHNSAHKKTENLGVNVSNHVNTKTVAEVKATCTKVGYTAGVYCNDCQKYISGHKEIAINPSNHVNTKTVPETPATFDKVGYTEGVFCNDCQKYISGHKEIPSIMNIGDVDGNGKIDATDARLALRAAVGLDTLSVSQKKTSDVDFDGQVTSSDARLILRAAVGLEELRKRSK